MNTQQIIGEIQQLPVLEQRKLWDSLTRRLGQDAPQNAALTEAEVAQVLLTQGIISDIPAAMNDAEDDECPVLEIPGRPLSEIILEERR